MNLILAVVIIIMLESSIILYLSIKRRSIRQDDSSTIVDTSVLMDGRIIAVAKTGFIMGKLIIPRKVIGELQFLADNSDSDKRKKARFGLDVVTELQAISSIDVEILNDQKAHSREVDELLLELAKKYQASICTLDYNLNKVAKVESIPVLNINDLALSLRLEYLPGEKFSIELSQKGQDAHQAVGHLADGTMVVVDRANKLINRTVEVEVVNAIQTAAGRMMFAKLVPKRDDNVKKDTSKHFR